VDIFPGFAAASLVYDWHDGVAGVVTQERGLAADGSRRESWEAGTIIKAKATLLAEGCRGSLSQVR
jgi:electron-transferring-flavoprotein dehydrogenase